MRQLAKDPGHHSQVLQVIVGLEQRVALHSAQSRLLSLLTVIFSPIDKAFSKAMK